jgi:hypothetical protein
VLNKIIKDSSGLEVLYSGEVDARGQPHGCGEDVITSKGPQEGFVEMGFFAGGLLHGIAQLVTSDGTKYTGEYIRGCLEGVGRIERVDGQRYAGQCHGGKRHGFGTLAYIDGRMIIGWWVDDLCHGIALFVYADGSKAAVTLEHDEEVSQTLGLIFACLLKFISILFRSPGGCTTRERNDGYV